MVSQFRTRARIVTFNELALLRWRTILHTFKGAAIGASSSDRPIIFARQQIQRMKRSEPLVAQCFLQRIRGTQSFRLALKIRLKQKTTLVSCAKRDEAKHLLQRSLA